MNFDIKDVKSWANRHEVKVGDRGYFCENISWLQKDEQFLFSEIDFIDDTSSRCFVPKKRASPSGIGFSFFLPLDAIKEDKIISIELYKTIEQHLVNIEQLLTEIKEGK